MENTQICDTYKKQSLGTQKQYVYIIKCQEYIKIGTTNDTNKRFKDFKTSSPFHIDLICLIEFDSKIEGCKAESHLHSVFNNLRVSGEWFFYDKSIIDYIKENYKTNSDFSEKTIQKNKKCLDKIREKNNFSEIKEKYAELQQKHTIESEFTKNTLAEYKYYQSLSESLRRDIEVLKANIHMHEKQRKTTTIILVIILFFAAWILLNEVVK